MKEKRIIIIAFILFFSISIMYGIVVQIEKNRSLKDTVQVIATITHMYNTRGPETIEVKFKFDDKLMDGSFATYRWDNLAVNDKIKILVSKQHPDKYIKYLGLAK